MSKAGRTLGKTTTGLEVPGSSSRQNRQPAVPSSSIMNGNGDHPGAVENEPVLPNTRSRAQSVAALLQPAYVDACIPTGTDWILFRNQGNSRNGIQNRGFYWGGEDGRPHWLQPDGKGDFEWTPCPFGTYGTKKLTFPPNTVLYGQIVNQCPEGQQLPETFFYVLDTSVIGGIEVIHFSDNTRSRTCSAFMESYMRNSKNKDRLLPIKVKDNP